MITLLVTIAGCSGESQSKVPEPPRFNDAKLAEGRSVWMGTCRNCHLMGVAGAPAISNTTAWSPRKEKGLEALYGSALNGIKRDGKFTMPPHGGNKSLSPEQVRTAVDYMLASVDQLAVQK